MVTAFNAKDDIKGTRWFAGMRDHNRQRCYNWEFRNLRGKPSDGAFTDKNAAKGFARLCVKVGLARLEKRLILRGIDPTEAAKMVAGRRAEYRAHFTKDNAKVCCGGRNGVYFAAWGWTKVIIAHEIAHFIDICEAELTRSQRAGHGPDWLGWFGFLLCDVVGFEASHIASTLTLRVHVK